jgi:hypothetical protein
VEGEEREEDDEWREQERTVEGMKTERGEDTNGEDRGREGGEVYIGKRIKESESRGVVMGSMEDGEGTGRRGGNKK